MSVLDTHEVVEDGVECGREVVEEPREVHEVLIDSPVDMTVPEVDIAKPLDVKGNPREEEQNNDSNGNENGSESKLMRQYKILINQSLQ